MKPGFRQSMSWLHTWCGLSCGWLLCAIFLTGTLGVFREPITRWMEAVPVTDAASGEQADPRARARDRGAVVARGRRRLEPRAARALARG